MSTTVTAKTCPRCGQHKPHTAFKSNRRRKDKLAVHCRECEAVLAEIRTQQPDPVRGKTKLCAGCATVKPYADFNKNSRRNDGLQTYCRECQSARSRVNYATSAKRREQIKRRRRPNLEKNRDIVRQYVLDYLKAHPCADCGETNMLTLQFDHVRGEKVDSVSVMVTQGYGLKRIKAEIAKCEVRCANCHQRKTARDFNYRIIKRLEERERE